MTPSASLRFPWRAVMLGALVIGASALLLERARAGDDEYFPPVTHAATLEECGSCHLAFPAAMLPARSWRAMMGDLGNHFGEDASLDPTVQASITDYLVANAADVRGSKLLRGLSPQDTPLRITELPKWVREHREVSRAEWNAPDVKSKANCAACHKDAEKGYYDDE